MEELQSWRQLLLQIIANDPSEHERLLKELAIDSKTMDRWVKGTHSPRDRFIFSLLRALPQYDYLPDLMAKEFPDVVEQYRQASRTFLEPETAIPAILYERILQQRSTALNPVALWGVCTMTLQKLVSQFSKGQSVTAVVVRCVPPDGDDPNVRMLREYAMDASDRELLRRPLYFLGVDSIAGSVVEACQPQVYNEMSTCVATDPFIASSIQSMAGYPICQEGNIAGCLLIYSTQEYFFTSKWLELVGKYSHLLALAFREHEFYPKRLLALKVVPRPDSQLVMMKVMQEQIKQMRSEAEKHQEFLSYTQAEQRVIEQLLQERGK